jgi:hypothetical protein
MPAEPLPIPSEVVEANSAYEAMGDMLREKILFGLSIYPFLSPSMLHVFLGTATPKSIWKDVVLKALVEEGLVCSEEVTLTSPHDRTQTYNILRLAENTYTAPTPITTAATSA